MKRFYKQASFSRGDKGYYVHLDKKPIKTPSRFDLLLPSAALGEAIAQEWDAQVDKVDPNSMPLMALACSAIDLVALQKGAIVDELVDLGESDTLLYPISSPQKLRERQDALWTPLVRWCENRFDIKFVVAEDSLAVGQPDACLERLRRVIENQDDFHLSALACAARAGNSLIAGLAILEEEITADRAFQASELEPLYNKELWGEDKELEKKLVEVRKDFDAAARFLRYLHAN